MPLPTILVPRPEEQKEVRPGWHEEWYKKLEDVWNPPFELPNVEFHYNKSDFFNRNLSIRAARDWKNNPFWFIVAMIFYGGTLAWNIFGIWRGVTVFW